MRQLPNDGGNAGLFANEWLENGRYCIWYDMADRDYA
jgi:hypothetical protein